MTPGDRNRDSGVNHRQRGIREQFRAGVRFLRGDVQRQLECSPKTAKRELDELRDRGLARALQCNQGP